VVPIGTDINTVFNASCNLVNSSETLPDISASYAPFPEIGAGFGPITSAEIVYKTNNEKIVYCVQDNAKNRLVGTYPFDPNLLIGCFSDGSQSVIPNFDDESGAYYLPLLRERINASTYGYELTDAQKNDAMQDLRTKLAQNIETIVKQQYCPTTATYPTTESFITKTINLEEATTEGPSQYASKVRSADGTCSPSAPRNTKGYYYFQGDANNTLLEIAGTPRLTGTKVLIVEGAHIYLKEDIRYFSRNSSLVIIALKKDGRGGNVYVNPQVTNIDATIIADGSLINATRTPNSDVMVPKIWFNDSAGELQNPLTINGRLLTYNTRGGSLVVDGGTTLKSISTVSGTNDGKCFDNTTLNTSCLETTAALQDLERFRVVMRVPDEQSNRCTLHVTGISALNRPDILIRSGF
jgi:hypothetical protein